MKRHSGVAVPVKRPKIACLFRAENIARSRAEAHENSRCTIIVAAGQDSGMSSNVRFSAGS